MTRKPRTAKTRHGEEVHINTTWKVESASSEQHAVRCGTTTWKVEGGWEGYVLNNQGFAVLVFVPGE